MSFLPHESIVDHVMNELSDYDPYIFSNSMFSVYLKFRDLPKGMDHQFRISDHAERERFGSKWQLRLDGVPPKDEQKQWSYYYDDPDQIIERFIRYITLQ